MDLANTQIRFHRVDPVDRPDQQIAAAMGVRLFLGDLAGVHERLHVGVVLGQTQEFTIAQHVRPGVADMGDGGSIALPADHGDSGAHPLEVGALGDDVAHLELGLVHRVGQLGQHVFAIGDRQPGEDGRDRRTGQFACHVPAHAVGDDEQVVAGVAGILVTLAHESHVAARRVAEDEGHGLLPQLDDGLSHPQ